MKVTSGYVNSVEVKRHQHKYNETKNLGNKYRNWFLEYLCDRIYHVNPVKLMSTISL
jgi:hypothetical protein